MDRIGRWLVPVFLLTGAGCATVRVEGVAERLPEGGQGITIEVSSFSFRPNVVSVKAGVTLTVTAVSRSSTKHNITIVTPDGETLESFDIFAGETVPFKTTLARPGRYTFYCDRFLHRPLGMEGVLVADDRPALRGTKDERTP